MYVCMFAVFGQSSKSLRQYLCFCAIFFFHLLQTYLHIYVLDFSIVVVVIL